MAVAALLAVAVVVTLVVRERGGATAAVAAIKLDQHLDQIVFGLRVIPQLGEGSRGLQQLLHADTFPGG